MRKNSTPGRFKNRKEALAVVSATYGVLRKVYLMAAQGRLLILFLVPGLLPMMQKILC
jgi:hypothetical protein